MRQDLTIFFLTFNELEKVGKFSFLSIEHHPGKNLKHMPSNLKYNQ